MNPLKLPLLFILILSNLLVTTPVTGQQKRRTADKVPPKAATPAPPTFETLLAADSYKVYVEVRGVGALVHSSALNEVLEPVLKLGGPPTDFVEFVSWLKSHADQLTTSRMLVAVLPNAKEVPEFVAAIEFSSAEEAAKLETPLNGLLPKLFPPVTPPQPSGPSAPSPDQKSVVQPTPADQKPPAPVPGYVLQRQGSLLLVSPAPLQLKKLRPAGSKPLSEDPNFRVAYNRFSADPVFVFVDISAFEKEQQEREKQWAEEQKKMEEARKAEAEKKQQEQPEEPQVVTEAQTKFEVQVNGETKTGVLVGTPAEPAKEPEKEPSQNEIAMSALSSLSYSMFSAVAIMPDALGIGFSPENDSFDVRALMIDAAGKTSDPLPFFFSWIKFAAPMAPQSPSVIPNDSELVGIFSIDFQQLYARMQARPTVRFMTSSGASDEPIEPEAPLLKLERALKIKIKDDLLPLLGSEVAVSLPSAEYNPFSPPRSEPVTPAKDDAKESKETPRAPFVVVSLRDREGMQRLMPKLIEGLAGKAAAALGQTERREDTELVSYAGMFAYAFVGNFLVLSNDPATVRHVVDSYLKGATLAADIQFRNGTRWQPHELQAQLYVSPAFMEGYKTWASGPNARISDAARAFFARMTAPPQPVTYSLSNDGFGTLHELHVPKNVLLVALAGAASTANPPPHVANERTAMTKLWTIANAERMYKDKNPAYGSVEELIQAQLLSEQALTSEDYKFEITITAEGYSISATPVEYGKSGKLSLFLDQTGILRGADHGGNPASASDPPVGY